jgi:hypothetical protein
MAEVEFKLSARCTNTAPSAGTIFNYTNEAQEYAAEARVAATDAEEWAVVSRNAANRATESAEYVEGVVQDARDEVGAELSPKVDLNTLEIADNREDITILDKRVTNLEQGITPDPFVTDSTGKVPVNALPYAEVVKVGGMTYRDEATSTLKDAKPTSIESRGANIWDGRWETGGIVTSTGIPNGDTSVTRCVDYLSALENTVYYICKEPSYKVRTYYYDSTKNFISATYIDSNKNNHTTPPGIRFIKFQTIGWMMTEAESIKFCISISNPETDGKYFRYGVIDTLEIPEAVQALDGYGEGVNESVYNYIDWKKKQFVKRVKKVVFDGSADENITIVTRRTKFTLFKFGISGGYNYSPAITNRDIPYKIAFDANDAHFYVNESEVLFALSNSIATDVATLKTYLASNPIEVIYELATPEITDISHLITSDNFIKVEGGGTITVVNEYGFSVPSEIVYQIKEVTI